MEFFDFLGSFLQRKRKLPFITVSRNIPNKVVMVIYFYTKAQLFKDNYLYQIQLFSFVFPSKIITK